MRNRRLFPFLSFDCVEIVKENDSKTKNHGVKAWKRVIEKHSLDLFFWEGGEGRGKGGLVHTFV